MKAIVVGNGPSLSKETLNFINENREDCIHFGVNRINILYDETSWRPDIWVIADRSNSTHYSQDIQRNLEEGIECYVRADIPRGAEALMWQGNYPFTFRLYPECDHVDCNKNPATEWHEPFCKYGGSLFVAIQHACSDRHELSEVCLIGCDGNYRAHSYNNFVQNYVHIDAHSAEIARTINETQAQAHKIAKREAAKRGIRIYNATRGSAFTMHPYISLEDFLLT